MPRVVPSQIIAMIDQSQPEKPAQTLSINHASVGGFMAIVRLIDELPQELLTVDAADYNNLARGVEAIRTSVEFWQRKGEGQTGLSSVKGVNILDLIRAVLVKCPDQLPSPQTASLPFVTDPALREISAST